jgi:5-methylcytosine-specific restriction endonuclease McrA
MTAAKENGYMRKKISFSKGNIAKRKRIPIEVKQLVLHEGGYKCANPSCRTILTLDIHHLVPVSEGGPNTPENLLALCPNCHSLYHNETIPAQSIKAWKMILLSLNEAFDKRSVDSPVALKYATNASHCY